MDEQNKPKKDSEKRERRCSVPTCGKIIGEFGHSCNYPGKPKDA